MAEIPRHLIERAWDVYMTFMTDTGAPPPNKLYWLGGFNAAVGLLVGTIQIGIPEGTPTRDVMIQLIEEIGTYSEQIEILEDLERKKMN